MNNEYNNQQNNSIINNENEDITVEKDDRKVIKYLIKQSHIKKTKNVVPSEKYKDYPWRIQEVSFKDAYRLQQLCTVVPKNSKLQIPQLDGQTYALKLCVASIIEPDLCDVELQDAMNVKNPEDLLSKLLNAGEMAELLSETNKINGFDPAGKEEFAEMVEEAKN